MTHKPRLYNLARLYEIQNADEIFIRHFVHIFLENVPFNSLELVNACKEDNWDMVYFLAHKMKANIDLIGLEDLKNELQEVELYAKANSHLDELPKKIAHIHTVIETVSQQLKEDFSN